MSLEGTKIVLATLEELVWQLVLDYLLKYFFDNTEREKTAYEIKHSQLSANASIA